MLQHSADNLDEAVPYSLVMAIVPQMITDSAILGIDSHNPENEDALIQATEMQGIKLLSSFDPGDTFRVTSLHAMYPWKHPKGYFLALYFPCQLTSTKSMATSDNFTLNQLMLMLGVVVHRAHANIINLAIDQAYKIMEEYRKPVLELFSEHRELILTHLKERSAFQLEPMNLGDNSLLVVRQQFKTLLHHLRTRFQQVITEWIAPFE